MAVAFVFVTSRISSTAWPRRWTAFLYASRTFVLKPTSADIGPEGNRRAPLTARDKAKVQGINGHGRAASFLQQSWGFKISEPERTPILKETRGSLE